MSKPPELLTIRDSLVDQVEVTDATGRHLRLLFSDLKNTRDLRTLLLEAAYKLQEDPELADAHIQLFECRLLKSRVAMELERFRSITKSQISNRISLVIVNADYLPSKVKKTPSTASQEAVVAYLLQRYLKSNEQSQFRAGVSVRTLAKETHASLPTIYKVLKAFEHCITRDPEDKTLRLSHFSKNDWQLWMQRANQLSSVYFINRMPAARSANKMAKELSNLQRSDLAIGGLMGAMQHLPALDATGSPQLDILVHGTRRADLSFVSELDPGLQRFEGRSDLASVVVHFIDRPEPLFESHGGRNWGSLPDCIANMQKAGLVHQVDDALNLVKEGIKA